MSSIGPVGKNQRNRDQNYEFRGIDDIFNAVNPAFVKHQVSVTFDVLSMTQTEVSSRSGAKGFHTVMLVQYWFRHADGSKLSTTTYGESVSYDDKGVNKALQAALKYALLQMFLIAVDEPEADHEQPEIVASAVEELASADQMEYLATMGKGLDDEQKERAREKQQELGIETLRRAIPVSKWEPLMEFIEDMLAEPFGEVAEDE